MENRAHAKKCITCHAGSRDTYQVAVALYEAGLLDCLVTDFYSPDFAKKIFWKRHNNALPSAKVISVWRSFLYQKILKGPYAVSDAMLSEYAVKRALKNGSDLFLLSYVAYEAFARIKENGLANRCILFQVHPHPLSVRKILQEEIKRVPLARDSILGELEMNEDSSVVKRLVDECALADHCIVASSFTKETMIENGIAPEKISVVPYGVDATKFAPKEKYNTDNGSLDILFVGQMIQRKGLYYLLEAVKKINHPKVNLTIVGRGSIDENLLSAYLSDSNITVKINVSPEELVQEFHKNDVLIFPSLIEGFGLVILEAMSSGLPVICTHNTAGRDLFLNGDEGMIVPMRSVEAIVEKIEWCLLHKTELAEMGKAAARTAALFTWERFRKGIVQVYMNS